ncbi:DNA-binding protein [Streptomyces sp. C1-2]|uniref:helix-turn-helix transcriptional regulator n=1 Tax=Streptomyces sp. C1-2 TaxID=2720022 RepID=UPI0014325E87|nr:DNA-binding protein [Streptomyces sp. C1-2]NJP72512.1 DNA-binding protein [Streptomyces sp. C1-2]
MNSSDALLSPKEVCERWPAIFPNPQSLAERRWRGTGPAYVKTHPGKNGRVFYRASAIEAWLDGLTVNGGQRAA